MKYLYYTKSVLEGVTYKNKTIRKEIIEEKEDRYILKGYNGQRLLVLKSDMLYRAPFTRSIEDMHIETPKLLEKYKITELEDKYSNLIYEFLHTHDHDKMKRIVDFFEGVL